MAELIDKAIDFLGKYSWAVFVVTAFVVFIPDDFAKQIGLIDIKTAYKGYCWLGFILSGAIWVKSVFSYIDNRIIKTVFEDKALKKKDEAQRKQEELQKKEAFENLRLRLSSLDRNERLWIIYCLTNNIQTLSAEATNQTANSLLNKGIVSRGSGHMLNLPFHIKDIVWKYLIENKEDFIPDNINEPMLLVEIERFKKTLHLF